MLPCPQCQIRREQAATQQADRADAIKTLGELIKDIKFAMLTTVEDDGSLRSRPMAT